MNFETLTADVNKILDKHYTSGRGDKRIDTIILHHNGGNLTVEGCWSVRQSRAASLGAGGSQHAKYMERTVVVRPDVREDLVRREREGLRHVGRRVCGLRPGRWGNGAARRDALRKTGYDHAAVQARVNELLR